MQKGLNNDEFIFLLFYGRISPAFPFL